MNYYPFHIGDYVAHTSHLSWEEDIAYRRMIDAYYLREGPLPLDVAAIARLIRMRDSGAAIQAVLDEFFVPEDDGWHQRRCDAEIAGMKARQARSEERDDHERERMRRHRERRKRMFEALREKGIVPAWDTSTKELERLCKEEPATHLQREQVETCNAPATAIPTPTPTPTPTPEKKEREARSPSGSRIPAEFPTDAETAWAAAERPDLDVSLVAARFRDHWAAKAGKDGRKADWPATWRNWVRNERGWPPARASPPPRRSAAVEAGLALAGYTRNPEPETIDVLATEPSAPRLG